MILSLYYQGSLKPFFVQQREHVSFWLLLCDLSISSSLHSHGFLVWGKMAWLASMPQPSVTQLIGTGLCLCAELMGFALGLLSLPLCRWLRRIGCRVGTTLHAILSRLYSCSMTVRGSMSPFCKFLVLWLKKVKINSETRGKYYWCLREQL